MPAKAVYVLVFPGFADWEPSHALAELRRHGNYRVETVALTTSGLVTTSMTGPHAQVELDAPLEASAVTTACHRIADAHDERRARIGTFVDLLPDKPGLQRSAAGLHAPVGFDGGRDRQGPGAGEQEIRRYERSPRDLLHIARKEPLRWKVLNVDEN